MIKKVFITLIISMLLLFSFSIVAYADDSNTRSIVGDYFNKVFDIEPNSGKGFLDTESDVKTREILNNSIYNGTIDSDCSLYDRFGGNLKFIPYFGEKRITTNVLDRFYTDYINSGEDFTLSAADILKIFGSPAISNNAVYDGRPNVLSSDDIEAGSMDPRVHAYSSISSVGGDAALGNAILGFSNFFTTLVAELSGSGLYSTINDIWTWVCDNGLTDLLGRMVDFLLPIALFIFVLSLISMAVKTIRGSMTGRTLITNIFGAGISVGIVMTLVINPIVFSTILTRAFTIVDDVFDSALNLNASEVVQSDRTENIRQAALWEKNVFEPWCYGMFQREYDELYTQYDTNSRHVKLPQSHDDVRTEWSDGSIKYDSKSLTGDVQIKIGPNKVVRNWAALAWSTQSIYHIDAVDPDNGGVTEVSLWPKATTTPMNDKIFVDNFRWLDAMLNISPEYAAPDEIITNYSNSRPYSQKFISAGFRSLYMSLLIIPIAYLTLRKLKNSVLVITIGFRLIWQSVLNIVFPNKYDIIGGLKQLIRPIYDVCWWSLVIFAAISIYTSLAGNSLLVDFIWVMIGVYLCRFKPIRTPRQLKTAIRNAKIKTIKFAKDVKSGISKRMHKNKPS